MVLGRTFKTENQYRTGDEKEAFNIVLRKPNTGGSLEICKQDIERSFSAGVNFAAVASSATSNYNGAEFKTRTERCSISLFDQ